MSSSPKIDDLTPEDSHPKAAEALTDAFFWDSSDDASPLGNDTGSDTFLAFREWRDENPNESPVTLLDTLLARWEVVNAHWDAMGAVEVQAIGEEDEYSLLTRDEAVIGLAFAQIIVEGELDDEVRRRALLAVARQTLPALLGPWDHRATERVARLDRMRIALARPWNRA